MSSLVVALSPRLEPTPRDNKRSTSAHPLAPLREWQGPHPALGSRCPTCQGQMPAHRQVSPQGPRGVN